MDILVNFSDLVNKDRKDLSSWKAACSALNNMMRIYPECFSTVGDSFAPLRVHAKVGAIEGVDQHKLEAFIGKFLLVLDNEVHIEKVDFSGEERFIKAGQHAAYCVNIYGGECHAKNITENPEMCKLRHFTNDMKDYFDKKELRMLYHGINLPSLPSIIVPIEGLHKDLAIEFLAGGDRFTRFDISMALEAVKKTGPDALQQLENDIREELKPALADGHITPEFLDKEIQIWIKKNDLKDNHLGFVFNQYSETKELKTERKKPKEVYKEIVSAQENSKGKGQRV